MARKYDLISELYNRTCKTVVSNPQNWQAFLASACRNYKLRYDEQLLVYAQRPDATAVLEIEQWNKIFGRWVNRGARGIAVFADENRSRQRLTHYFDISDTHESRYSRTVPIWDMRQEYEADVIETLESTFGEIENKSSLAEAIMGAARNAAEDNIPDYLQDLYYATEGSSFEEVEEDIVAFIYKNVVTNSVAYMMMSRLGVDTDGYFELDDLLALVFYLHYEAPEEEQNFAMVMEMLRAGSIEDEEDTRPSPLDELFAELEMKNPDHIALKYYRSYHSGAAKTLKSIQITLAARLEKFNLESLASLTTTDELDLPSLGEKKVALFALIPDNDSSFNFLVSILYTQLFQQLFYAADHIHGGSLPVPVHFLMDEFANVSLPDDFDKILSVMRSRGVSVSIILQNLAQLKALFEKQWESIVGNCDEFLYLGGNEQSTHKYVSELLGKETIDTNTYGKSSGRSGNYSTNYQISGRELLTPDEVRMLDNQYAILFIRGERPVMDFKYDILKHPNVALTTDGKASAYKHGEVTVKHSSISVLSLNPNELPEENYGETTYELLSDEDFEVNKNIY